jgi:parallel beta-helix repeat protein
MLKTLLAAIVIIALLVSLDAGIEAAEAQTLTITIKPDGSLDPLSNVLQREGNVYTATADLNFSINVQKSNIILDGANHSLRGPGSSQNFVAITLMASNITITGFSISGWRAGVYGAFNNNTITNNVFVDNYQGIAVYASDYVLSKNSISGSIIGVLIDSGAIQPQGDNNIIIQNQLANNNVAFNILNSNGTTITKNNVTDNAVILTLGTLKANSNQAGLHTFYLNNFVNNKQPLHVPFGGPFASSVVTLSPAGSWDNGTVGNYWSDYSSKYPDASELGDLRIGDTPYLIEETATWSRDYPNGPRLEGTSVLGVASDLFPLLDQVLIQEPTPTPTPTPTPSPEPTPIAETFPASLIFVASVGIALAVMGLLVYLKKRHHASGQS